MQITEEILSQLFDLLKNGDSNGISLARNIPEAKQDDDFMLDLYHRAINEGFAVAGSTRVYGLDVSIRLSDAARGYKSYLDFSLRNSQAAKSIKNNIMTINAPTGGFFSQDSNFENAHSTSLPNANPIQNPPTNESKEKISIKAKLAKISVIIAGSAALIELLKLILEMIKVNNT